MKKSIFNAADILLPPFEPSDNRWSAYAVIACDQFTSEPEYWEAAEKIVGESLSTLGLILPEAYLETEKEETQRRTVLSNMKTVEEKLVLYENCLIYIERTLPDGRVRPGIIGKLDLEAYDFSPDSKSPVRATEETVVSRIPPRVAVRKEAAVELPHVMVFADDSEKKLISPLSMRKDEMELLYSFELMLGGGSIAGYKLSGSVLAETLQAICEYENSADDGLLYAMGDGNHSLASAKAHFEQIKAEQGARAMDHPARYALVEVVDLYDGFIEFEPIYRLLKNCKVQDVLEYVDSYKREEGDTVAVTAVYENEERIVEIPMLHALPVGSLQQIIDEYLSKNPSVECDYIHGTESLRNLSAKENCVGFLCPGVEKDSLFGYVAKNGALPRKTFSMGEAASKRYYIEARKIVD